MLRGRETVSDRGTVCCAPSHRLVVNLPRNESMTMLPGRSRISVRFRSGPVGWPARTSTTPIFIYRNFHHREQPRIYFLNKIPDQPPLSLCGSDLAAFSLHHSLTFTRQFPTDAPGMAVEGSRAASATESCPVACVGEGPRRALPGLRTGRLFIAFYEWKASSRRIERRPRRPRLWRPPPPPR